MTSHKHEDVQPDVVQGMGTVALRHAGEALRSLKSTAERTASKVATALHIRPSDDVEYVIKGRSAAGDQHVTIDISPELYRGLIGYGILGRKKRLASQIEHYEQLLDMLWQYEREKIDTGEEENTRRAIINLRDRCGSTISSLKAELTECKYGGSRFTTGSAQAARSVGL